MMHLAAGLVILKVSVSRLAVFVLRETVVFTLLCILLLFIRALSQLGETCMERALTRYCRLVILFKEDCEFAMQIIFLLSFNP